MFVSPRARSLPLAQLTSLRFFAALFVVLYHSKDLAGSFGPLGDRILGFGFSAVSFFFILSGFILTFIYSEESTPFSSRLFWIKRLARIYPLFFVGLLLDAPRVFTYFFAENPAPAALAKISLALGANLLMVQAWIPRLASTWNTPGWSLSVEVFFYALFPFLFKGFCQMTLARTRFVLSLCFAFSLILISPFVFLAEQNPLSPSLLIFAKMNPILHLPEFIFGMALARWALLSKERGRSGNLEKWGFFPALSTWILFMILGPDVPHLLVHNGLFTPLFGILILSAASGKAFAARFLHHPFWIFWGSASYAVYILHQPIKTFVLSLLETLHMTASPLALTIYLGVLLTASALAYWGLEEPVRRWVGSHLNEVSRWVDKPRH